MEVKSVNSVGAFLDWGILKDLLVPFREQKIKLQTGGAYIVYIYEDEESGRIVATTKIDKYIDSNEPNFDVQEKAGIKPVDLLICNRTNLGYKAIINNKYWGVLYENEVF